MISKFRSKVWDPLLIVSQIVSMQFQFYSSLLIINYIFNKFIYSLSSTDKYKIYSLSHIFDHRLVNFHDVNNTFVCIAFLANSLFRWVSLNASQYGATRVNHCHLIRRHSDTFNIKAINDSSYIGFFALVFGI